MSYVDKNLGAIVHVDLSLIPLKDQVNLIWLSKVIKSLSELEENTGINEMYIKHILEHKAVILQRWKLEIQCKQFKPLNGNDDYNAIDILLLEWVRRSTLNKIKLEASDIRRQAEAIKQLFEVPTYKISPQTWSKLIDVNVDYKQFTISQSLPLDINSILTKRGLQLLKRETFQKFINILEKQNSSKGKVKLLDNIIRQKHIIEYNKDQENRIFPTKKYLGNKKRKINEQNDDLIIVEKHIECIDVTDDNIMDYVQSESSLSPHYYADNSNHTIVNCSTEETSSDFPKLTQLELFPHTQNTKIKEEPTYDNEDNSNEFTEVQIKNEIIENVFDTEMFDNESNHSSTGINNNSNQNIEILQTLKEEIDIKPDPDGQNEFLHNSVKYSKTNEIRDNDYETILQGSKVIKFENNINEVLKHKYPNKIKTEDNENLKTTNLNSPKSTTLKPNKSLASNDNSINTNGGGEEDDDDGDETEIVYEIEDSDEELKMELQEIINNYKKKQVNKTKNNNETEIYNTQNEISSDNDNDDDDNDDENEIVTIVDILPDDDDEEEEEFNITNIHELPESPKKLQKRKITEIQTDSEEMFDFNLPSTSRSAAANLKLFTSKATSSLSSSSKLPSSSQDELPNKSPRLDLPEQQKPEITLENNVDAIKYLQHIKNYLLSQNDEVAVRLLLNLQMAFININ